SHQLKREVTLYCSILKKENFELVCQKATEVGAYAICSIIAERTVKTGLNRPRLEKIIKEAAEQSGRSSLPILLEPMSFPEALSSSKANDLNVLFDKEGKNLDNNYSNSK